MKTFLEYNKSNMNWNVQPNATKPSPVVNSVTSPTGKPPDHEVTYHKDIGLPSTYDMPKHRYAPKVWAARQRPLSRERDSVA